MTARPRRPDHGDVTQSAIETATELEVIKLDETRHRITGFAMVSCNKNGEPVYDLQGDHISPEELVKAVQDFAAIVGEYRVDDMHDRSDTGRVVESLVLTAELQKALGIPEGTQPIGWLVTVEVPKAEFELVKAGKRPMFSIEARAERVPADATLTKKAAVAGFGVGDRVKVKLGRNHDAATKDAEGVVNQIGSVALGIKFDGMSHVHKWYVADELEAA